MFPGINPKKMQAVMKQMGISQEEIPAEKVIIEKSDGSQIKIENPSVLKVNMQGQETFQISGDVSEQEADSEGVGERFRETNVSRAGGNGLRTESRTERDTILESDIQTIIEKTGASESQARATLEKNNGDLAETILELSE